MKENEHGWEEPNACPICNGPLKYTNWWLEDIKCCMANHKICLSLNYGIVSDIYLDHNKFILHWNKDGFLFMRKVIPKNIGLNYYCGLLFVLVRQL